MTIKNRSKSVKGKNTQVKEIKTQQWINVTYSPDVAKATAVKVVSTKRSVF